MVSCKWKIDTNLANTYKSKILIKVKWSENACFSYEEIVKFAATRCKKKNK